MQTESNLNIQNYKYRIKFLNNKYQEVMKMMGSESSPINEKEIQKGECKDEEPI